MTARETKIAKQVLDYLHSLDGLQAHVLAIHAEIGGLVACSSAELDIVLGELDKAKYVIGVHSRFKGMQWNISDQGEAARLQM